MKRLILIASLSLSGAVFAEDLTVLSREPRMVTINQQMCSQQLVEHRDPTGSLVGGLIGGVIGNQFGGGTGKVAATILGTVAGAGIGASNSTSTISPRTVCTYMPTQVQQGEYVTFSYRGRAITYLFQ